MCGRTACTLDPATLQLKTRAKSFEDVDKYHYPHYNVPPGSYLPVLTSDASDADRELRAMRWGLVPSYSEKPEMDNEYRTINARSESMCQKPTYRRLVDRRRCALVVDGFYEWYRPQGGAKQPYFVQYDERAVKTETSETCASDATYSDSEREVEPLYMAGLYDVWHRGDEILYSFSVVTTESVGAFHNIHHRMPVILTEETLPIWLNVSQYTIADAKSLCTPKTVPLKWHQVDTVVNNVRNDTPTCIVPKVKVDADKKAAGIGRFFSSPAKPSSTASAASPTRKHSLHVASADSPPRKAIKTEAAQSPIRDFFAKQRSRQRSGDADADADVHADAIGSNVATAEATSLPPTRRKAESEKSSGGGRGGIAQYFKAS